MSFPNGKQKSPISFESVFNFGSDRKFVTKLVFRLILTFLLRKVSSTVLCTISGNAEKSAIIGFSSNHNIHKRSHGLCFWASDPLIDKFYKNLSIKGSEAQN